MASHPLNKILYAEDDEDIREIVTLALETFGDFEVISCSSGKEALENVKIFEPDLILLDVMMPGLDGPTVLKKIRGMPKTKSIPVVFMTAKVMEKEIQRFKDLGAQEVIIKPFDPRKLSVQILEIWDGLDE